MTWPDRSVQSLKIWSEQVPYQRQAWLVVQLLPSVFVGMSSCQQGLLQMLASIYKWRTMATHSCGPKGSHTQDKCKVSLSPGACPETSHLWDVLQVVEQLVSPGSCFQPSEWSAGRSRDSSRPPTWQSRQLPASRCAASDNRASTSQPGTALEHAGRLAGVPTSPHCLDTFAYRLQCSDSCICCTKLAK